MLDEEKKEVKEEVNEVEETPLEEEVPETAEEGDTLTPTEETEDVEGEESVESNEPEAETEDHREVGEEGQQPVEKMLTQSQVNELVGRARQEGRESARKELFERYGVGDDDMLNDLFGKGQMYEDLNNDYSLQGESYKNVMAENALLKSHIDENRWDDVKLILGGKGLDVTTETIESLLPTHPEWRSLAPNQEGLKPLTPDMAEAVSRMAPQENVATAKLRKLGGEVSESTGTSEEEQLDRLFGVKNN